MGDGRVLGSPNRRRRRQGRGHAEGTWQQLTAMLGANSSALRARRHSLGQVASNGRGKVGVNFRPATG